MSLGAETVVARLKRMVSDRSRRTLCAHALLLVLLWSGAWARPENEARPKVELGAELVSKRFSRLRQSCSLSRVARVRDERASKRGALGAWLAIDWAGVALCPIAHFAGVETRTQSRDKASRLSLVRRMSRGEQGKPLKDAREQSRADATPPIQIQEHRLPDGTESSCPPNVSGPG